MWHCVTQRHTVFCKGGAYRRSLDGENTALLFPSYRGESLVIAAPAGVVNTDDLMFTGGWEPPIITPFVRGLEDIYSRPFG